MSEEDQRGHRTERAKKRQGHLQGDLPGGEAMEDHCIGSYLGATVIAKKTKMKLQTPQPWLTAEKGPLRGGKGG